MRHWIVAAALAIAVAGCSNESERPAASSSEMPAPTAPDQAAMSKSDAPAGDTTAAARAVRDPAKTGDTRHDPTDATQTMSDEYIRKARAARQQAEQATLERLRRLNDQSQNAPASDADFERELREDQNEH